MRRSSFLRILLILGSLSVVGLHAESSPVGEEAPNFSFTTAKGTRDIRSYRGKWLLLQFGASWCQPSEFTACVFSDIRRQLDKKPFEFVEIGDDPTVTDFELFSDVHFTGIRGAMDRDAPAPFDNGSMPHWYLIDPRGIIREEGKFAFGDELRARIAKALPASFFSGTGKPLPASDDQSIEEYARLFSLREKHDDAEKAYMALFRKEPTNFRALINAGYEHAYVSKLLKGRQEIESNLPKDAVLSDSEQLLLHRLPSTYPAKFEYAEVLPPLLKRHPDSIYLKGWTSSNTMLPDEADLASTKAVYRLAQSQNVLNNVFFAALALESLGKADVGLRLAEPMARQYHGISIVQAVGLMARNQKVDSAREIAKPWAPELADKADAEKSWQGCFFQVVLSDWPAAAIYGARYAQLRTDRPLGLEIQWLAALRTKDLVKADALQTSVEQFVKSHPDYAIARATFEDKSPPEAKALISGFDSHKRLDNLLPYALLAERKGRFEQARAVLRELRQLSDTDAPENALATSLTLTLGH